MRTWCGAEFCKSGRHCTIWYATELIFYLKMSQFSCLRTASKFSSRHFIFWQCSNEETSWKNDSIFCRNKMLLISCQKQTCKLQNCYFLRNSKQICSKEPIISYFVRPKCPSGNCCVSWFLSEKTALSPKGYFMHILKKTH